jgi:hypothetical protein
MSFRNETIDVIEKALLTYVAANPKAADSVEGISKWWLGALQFDPCPAHVMMALERLEERGLMQRMRQTDGHVIFSAASS